MIMLATIINRKDRINLQNNAKCLVSISLFCLLASAIDHYLFFELVPLCHLCNFFLSYQTYAWLVWLSINVWVIGGKRRHFSQSSDILITNIHGILRCVQRRMTVFCPGPAGWCMMGLRDLTRYEQHGTQHGVRTINFGDIIIYVIMRQGIFP